MLPAAARVRTRRDHRLVATRGRRARRGALVVALVSDPAAPVSAPARAGVIAGRRVGPAVVRNRVKRRLREAVRSRLPELPGGSLLVVRALPGSADASFADLAAWLDAGLRGCGVSELPSRAAAE